MSEVKRYTIPATAAKWHAYTGKPIGDVYVMASDYDAAIRERDEARAELARWATWGTIEVAIRNPNVASYIEHWEKRALSAEAERDALRAAVEKCNGELGCKAYALLAPSAAPAPSPAQPEGGE